MQNEKIVENARRIGDEVLRPGLEELARKHRIIGDVRGLGVFFALDLVTDRLTKETLAPYGQSSPEMNELVAACRGRGTLDLRQLPSSACCASVHHPDDEAREGLGATRPSAGRS